MEYDDELERARARSSRRKTEKRKKSWKKEQDPLKVDDIELRSSLKSGKSRNQKWRQDDKKKRRIKIIIAEVVVLLLVVAIGAFAYVKSLWGRMATLDWDPDNVANPYLTVEQQEQMKGYWTIACFGVYSRDMSLGKGTNADVNIICNINRDTGEIRLVSVFRDTYLNINDKNSYNKINAAYAQGGPEQAVKALNKNLDLAIDDYATFNWAAVAQAINLLGGVDIELSDNEFSFINAFITEVVENTGIPSVQLTHAGLNHLDGVQAVAYGRLRLGDTDFARTERQRIVLEKAFDKAKSADWATLNAIVELVFPNIATSVQVEELVPLLWDIKDLHFGETAGFPMARGDMDVGKVGDCVIPQTLESNVQELHQFLFDEENYQVSSAVKEYSQHISEATGMYNVGKSIGHVSTDGGISASRYLELTRKNKSSTKASEAVESAISAADAETSEEVSTDENGTDEHGTDVNGTDEHGTDINGTDENGTDVFGTDENGTDENGTDVYGTDENGTNAAGETYSPRRPGTGPWGTGGWGNPNRSTEDLIDGPEEDWYEDAPYRPTNQTEGSDKPTYESTEGPGSENAGPGAGSNRPARPTSPGQSAGSQSPVSPVNPGGTSGPTASAQYQDKETTVDPDQISGPGAEPISPAGPG